MRMDLYGKKIVKGATKVMSSSNNNDNSNNNSRRRGDQLYVSDATSGGSVGHHQNHN